MALEAFKETSLCAIQDFTPSEMGLTQQVSSRRVTAVLQADLL